MASTYYGASLGVPTTMGGTTPVDPLAVVKKTSALSPQATQLGASLLQGGVSGLAAGGAQLGAGIGAGIAGLSYAGRKNRELLKKDVAKMEAGKLGWSQARKRQYLGEAMKAAEAQSRPVEAELARERASVGFGRSGAQTESLGAVQQAVQSGVAGAVASGEALSQQQAIAKEADIKARVSAQRDKVAGDWGNVMGGVAGIAGTVAGVGLGAKLVPGLLGSIATESA